MGNREEKAIGLPDRCGNGSAHERDQQIQLAFFHCDEQMWKPGDLQGRNEGSLSAARSSALRTRLLEELP